jgi:sugar-specific transcriptional regulator TrmB
MSAREVATEFLLPLGFTGIEAEAYVFLLEEAPATGYRVAQGINRTTANTYKALESLQQKGAVMQEDGATRLYRAVAPEEVLSVMERTWARQRLQAERALAEVGRGARDDRVYQLAAPGQVYERCRAMLAGCREIALMDVFPAPLAELREAVDEAVARGVSVALLAYEPVEVPGAEVVLSYRAATVMERWPGQWLNLVTDSAQHVLALLSEDGSRVRHAAWSASAFLAHLYHSGLLGELSTSALRRAIAGGASRGELAAVLARLDAFEGMEPAAYRRLTGREDAAPG